MFVGKGSKVVCGGGNRWIDYKWCVYYEVLGRILFFREIWSMERSVCRGRYIFFSRVKIGIF